MLLCLVSSYKRGRMESYYIDCYFQIEFNKAFCRIRRINEDEPEDTDKLDYIGTVKCNLEQKPTLKSLKYVVAKAKDLDMCTKAVWRIFDGKYPNTNVKK